MTERVEFIRRLLPFWYAEMAWAKELIVRAFELEKPDDILRIRVGGLFRELTGLSARMVSALTSTKHFSRQYLGVHRRVFLCLSCKRQYLARLARSAELLALNHSLNVRYLAGSG